MLKKSVGYIVISGSSFLLANVSLDAILSKYLPEPIIRTYTIKAQEFDKNPNKYNTLFIGSSHIHYHILPSQFDLSARSEAFSPRSFNMGSPNLDILETHELTRRVLQANPKNLKYVFLEPRTFSRRFQQPDSIRAVYFHNAQNTVFSLRYTLLSDLSLRDKVSKSINALKSFGFNFFNIGQLNGLASQDDSEQDIDIYSLGPLKDGFAEMKWYCSRVDSREGEACLKQIEKFRKRQESEADFYQTAKEDYSRALRTVKPFSEYQIEVLVELSKSLEKHGITTIFLNPPAVYEGMDSNISFKLAYERDKPPINVLDYSDPVRFPQLFSQEIWYDKTHLNQQGAQILTGKIANDFLANIRESSKQ